MTVPVNDNIRPGGFPGAVTPNTVVTSVAPLFTDHSDLAPFNQAVAATSYQSAGARQVAAQMFWSTDPRPASSPIQETLEISLTSERLVNTLAFDISIFPHTLDIQYYDSGAKNWLPLLDRHHGSLKQWIMRSIPTQLPNPANVPGHLHPQHSFLAHWRTVSLQTLPTYVQRLRFVLARYDNGRGPVGPLNTKVDYSLAMRNISLGYEVTGRHDIPRSLPVDDTYDESFASTDDLLGSSLAFALRDATVDRIIGNSDTDADAIWVCEPQPYPGAVVCFYADLRDSKNNPQVVDQIFLNPVHSGAHISVYYSNDLYTQMSFDSPTYALSTAQVSQTGNVALQDQRLQFGVYGEQAYLSLPNVPTDDQTHAQRNKATLGYDPTVPWWFGVIVRAGFDQGLDAVEHPIIDCGQWRLSLTADGLSLVLNGYDPRVCPITYQSGEDITAVVSYDGLGVFHVHAATDYDDATLDFWAQPFPPAPCPTITLGADLGAQFFANSDLLGLVLKDELADGTDDFLTDPYSYCTVAEFAVDDLPQSHSALLRLDVNTKRVNTLHPWALFGGPAVKYESLSWTPIPRDYVMARGWMHLPPTRARYLKLEITNLQAVPYEIAAQGPQQVKTFPPEVLAHYGQRLVNASSQTVPFGLDTQISLTGQNAYADVPVFISTGGNGDRGYTNTEVYIADDYSTGQRLRKIQNENWGYQTYHVGTDAPCFPTVCVHHYTEETVMRTAKIAYQCGLRQIIFATSSFTTQQDTPLYDDPFYTANNLVTDTNVTNMVYVPEMAALTSGESDETHASSLVYTSLRNVRAVQFAAQQTPATQLLPDDEFADPTFSNWSMVGDATAPIEGIVTSPVFGSLLPVARSLQLGYWGDIQPVFQTYGGITALGYTWGDLRKRSSAKTGPTFGGVASNPVGQPKGGRLYASARVVADADLASPLRLQIMDAITRLPLAEQDIEVKADQVTEWYVGYNIGEGAETSGNTWGDIDGAYLGSYQSYSDFFNDPSNDPHPDAAALGLMDSGQQWSAPASSTGSLALINNFAVCSQAGQVSWVDTQTPWGTLSVLLGTAVTTGTASASVPLLYLGHLRLMNDGRVIDVNTGRVFATVAGITTNDSLQVDFLPTSMLTAADWGGTWPASVDATVQAWAFVISRNGARVATVATTRAFGTMRGMAGAVGQQFQSFAWVPRQAGVPTGAIIPALPMPTDGAQDANGNIWTQANGQQWNTTQNPQQSPPVPPTFTANPAWQGGNTITGPAFPAGDQSPQPPSVCLVSTNVAQDTGTFSFRVTQLAATVPTNSYPVALLDQGSYTIGHTGTQGAPVTLLANGDLVKTIGGVQTTLLAGAVPPAQMTTGDIAIKYVRSTSLSAAFKSAHSINDQTQPQTLVFLVNGVVVGTYSALNIWTGVTRGLYTYNDNAGHFTITTGFAWSTDANGVSTGGAGKVLWGDVSQLDTRLWGDLAVNISAVNLNPVYVQMIQPDASTDTWYIDTMSLFSDPIVWEFSNDGGKSWVPGYEVANDPQAAIAFNPINPDDLTTKANQLCYRITCWAPEQWISHVAIRPWYLGFMRDMPTRPQGSMQGPNLNPWDHYPPIEADPRWRLWHLPIPRDWWFAFRVPDTTPHFVTPYVTDNVLITSG